MRRSVVITAICLGGCLAAPEPSGDPSNTPNNETNNDPRNNVPDGGGDMGGIDDLGPRPDAKSDPEVECASCTEGATRCSPDDSASWQECVDFDGCRVWVTTQTCEGEQTCDADDGCTCPDICDPGETDCSATGVMSCLVINGCPKLVDVGRDNSCGPPGPPAGAPSCDDAPHMSYCRECSADRGCHQRCENTSGWTCGLP